MKKVKSDVPEPTTVDRAFICPHDGSPLIATGARKGYCEKADGFPLFRWFWHPDANKGTGAWEVNAWACPTVCPECRRWLEWDGCCFACGPKVGAPGNRYRLERNHWVYERGPEAPVTEEQHAAMIGRFRALIASFP